MNDLKIIDSGLAPYRNDSFRITHPNLGQGYIGLTHSPFGNCQVFAIGLFNVILKHCSDPIAIEIIKACRTKSMQKCLMVIDVNRPNSGKSIKLLESAGATMKFNQPYTSSNKSEMNMIMFDLKNLK